MLYCLTDGVLFHRPKRKWNMKVKTGKTTAKAVRMFTDREEPRAAFWKQYEAVKAELEQESNVHVLHYYGIGGIGKSSLLKKLMSEMDEKLSQPRYIYIDLNNGQESRSVLDKMRNMLADSCKFHFPLFELGSYVYAKKLGDKVSPLEVQTLTKKSPVLNLMMSVAGSIPVLGIATKVLSLADQGLAMLRSHLKNHSRELKQIEVLEAEDLYKKLPSLFAMDLACNLEQPEEPLVIFLDTYETLVNELSSIGQPLKADEWIRGEEGLVQNIPHTLWVISGREKLKWERFDPEWKEAIESHILGNLSYADSEHFLEHAGITDRELRARLYTLTNGTPVYLDLCVDQFFRIREEDRTPDISMFGQNTFDLLERFMRYMGDTQQDLVYLLACLDQWDDALMGDIAAAALSGFSWTAYEKAKDYSFVLPSDEGIYRIHQTVGSVLRDKCPESIKSRVHSSLVRRFSGPLQEQAVLSPDYETALRYLAQAALLCPDRDALYTFYAETLRTPLMHTSKAGAFPAAKHIFDMLWDRVRQDQSDLLYALVLCDHAYYYRHAGDERRAKQLAEAALHLYDSRLGEDHPATITLRHLLASAHFNLGEYEAALELNRRVLRQRRTLLGQEHPDTLSAMDSMALSLSALGRHEEALELGRTVLEKTSAILGGDHPSAITAIHNLAFSFIEAGRYQEALEWSQLALEKRSTLYGQEHPDTLDAMNNLAIALSALGRREEALELGRTVLEKRTAVLGEDHPHTLEAMFNLTIPLYKLGRYEEALTYHRVLLEKETALFGEDHPDTLKAMAGLAMTLFALGKYEETLSFAQAVFEKRTAALGEDHPDTLDAMAKLAITLSRLSRYEEALPLSRALLEKRTAALGEDHPDTIDAMSHLALPLFNSGKREEAYGLFRAVYEKRLALLGEDHPDTIGAIKILAAVERVMERGKQSD